jgi:hypothetical protein
VPAVSPVSELENAPVPVPSLVREFAVVGFDAVDQHTPRTDTVAPPSEVTFPPLVAVVIVMFDAAVVATASGATKMLTSAASSPLLALFSVFASDSCTITPT